jgi:hypothetical protein
MIVFRYGLAGRPGRRSFGGRMRPKLLTGFGWLAMLSLAAIAAGVALGLAAWMPGFTGTVR